MLPLLPLDVAPTPTGIAPFLLLGLGLFGLVFGMIFLLRYLRKR